MTLDARKEAEHVALAYFKPPLPGWADYLNDLTAALQRAFEAGQRAAPPERGRLPGDRERLDREALVEEMARVLALSATGRPLDSMSDWAQGRYRSDADTALQVVEAALAAPPGVGRLPGGWEPDRHASCCVNCDRLQRLAAPPAPQVQGEATVCPRHGTTPNGDCYGCYPRCACPDCGGHESGSCEFYSDCGCCKLPSVAPTETSGAGQC